MPSETDLPEAPDHPLQPNGSPRFGTFRGDLTTLQLQPTARAVLPRLTAKKAVKKWQWFGVFDDGIAMGAAIVDLGYASNLFAWVFDRRSRTFRWERQENRPPWAVDVASTPRPATTSRAGTKLIIARRTEMTWGIEASWRDLVVKIDATATAPAATAVCPVAGIPGALHTTRKAACLEAGGRIAWSGGEHRLGPDAFLLLDHSHGITGRNTSWRWVMAQGRDKQGSTVALNAVSGFNEGLENVAWIDGEPRAIGKVNITFDPRDPSSTWAVYNEHLELELDVEGVRSHDVNLGLVASQYEQPIGIWRGRLFDRQVELVGVAEDHHAVW